MTRPSSLLPLVVVWLALAAGVSAITRERPRG
jgi:hypothetical protein